jgi:hypothetical protein
MADIADLFPTRTSSKCQQLQYLEKRLNQWAEWTLLYNDFGLGYPKKSMEAKLADTGGIWGRMGIRRGIPSNPNAEAMERCILELDKNYPRLAIIIRIQYLAKGTPNEKAKELNLSHTRYYSYLNSAKYWIDGYLRAQ